jgi:hypothetical protein
MKLADIIDFNQSYWNVLGRTGGNMVPSNKPGKKVNGVKTWRKKSALAMRKHKVSEVQRGPDYDWDNPNYKKGSRHHESPFGGWAKSPKGGDSITIHRRGAPTRKIIVRRVGKNSVEAIDDEGNHRLYDMEGNDKTGPIDYKRVHTGHDSRSLGSEVREASLSEVQTGTGLGGSGATERPAPGPSELEYDLSWPNLKKEFKGKDSRADIKTSKHKRETLKRYLKGRTANFKVASLSDS